MKLQTLAVIFIIIILPISILLSEYSGSQIETLNLQLSYDSKLQNATYDAIKAFQLNTVNSSVSDLSNSKIRDIEASVSTFFTSIASNFNLEGYNQDILVEYIPALVYTMYDGYYIYSAYENTLTSTEVSSTSEYQDDDLLYGLKPYIYYSCRYISGNIDVVITYSLDNYITVQGTDKLGDPIYLDGYLIDGLKQNNDGTINYRGYTIEEEELLKEYVGDTEYEYVKENGVKYYKEVAVDGTISWFSMLNGIKYTQVGFTNYETDDSALKYYTEALEFKAALNSAGLLSLKTSDAVDEDGNKLEIFGDMDIFDYKYEYIYEEEKIYIEEDSSNFNEHRKAVIRYSIEKNLSIAIANYNEYQYAKATFEMPELSEDEWSKIVNNVNIISFMQGISIGGKIYNGYSVVQNNKTEEFVSENAIYITASDGYYHKINSLELKELTDFTGIFNVNFERKSLETTNGYIYYYPNTALASYSSIVSSSSLEILGTESEDGGYIYINNIYDYLCNEITEIGDAYFTALGRERYSVYKVNNEIDVDIEVGIED